MRWWPVLMWALWACDGDRAGGADARVSGDSGRADLGRDATQDAADARVNDAVVRDARAPGDLDALRPDARGLDAAVVDVGMLDRGAADAAVPDAAMVDARVPDAAMVDARVPDAAADQGPPPACVGIRLPPPPESPDGREVCNYRDDDGDGLVDETFPYVFLGEPIRLTPEPVIHVHVGELRLAWAGDRYGVSWVNAWGMYFVTLDATGCPLSPVVNINQNPEGRPFLVGSHDMTFTGRHFAAVFTQDRLAVDGVARGLGTFVQMFNLEGRPVGDFIDVDPALSFAGYNAIEPMGDRFAVFGAAFRQGGPRYSAFIILDQEGRIVHGPSHPFAAEPGEGQSMTTLIGMAFDGEGFGMAWYGPNIWFTRWSPEGVVLTPPVHLIAWMSQNSGIAWTGQRYMVPHYTHDDVYIDILAPDGSRSAPSQIYVGHQPNGWGALSLLQWANDQLLVVAGVENGVLRRYSAAGGILGPDPALDQLGDLPRALEWSGRGWGALFLVIDWESGNQRLEFRIFGCEN